MARKNRKSGVAAAVAGTVAVAGVATIAALGSRKATAKTTDVKGSIKRRHGIEFDGCDHFKVISKDELEASLRANQLQLLKWLPKIDEIKADPGPFMADVMQILFPECTWPPPAATRFEIPDGGVMGWEQLVEASRERAAGFELAMAPGSELTPDALVGTALVWMFPG